MVDVDASWVADTPNLSSKYPVYTRGNSGEVAGKVSTPMMVSSSGAWVAEQLWKEALVQFGAFDPEEFNDGVAEAMAVIHGYIYINHSVSRVFGVRMPGASPDLMDRAYLGESSGVPPYEPRPGDDAPEFTERILATVNRVLSTTQHPDLEMARQRAAELRRNRPDLRSLSNEELAQRHRDLIDRYYRDAERRHLLSVYEGSVVTGLLQQVCAEIGDPTLEVRLAGGWGDVASAAPSSALWELSRMVRRSRELTDAFDAGVSDLVDRLAASSSQDAHTFAVAFDEFLFEYGSRSTDEWDAMPETWETHPHIVLGMVERMRLQPEDRAPHLMAVRVREEREKLTADLRRDLASRPELLQQFDTAMTAMASWTPARELSKTNTIRFLHEARLNSRELGRRYVESGHLESIEDITMLTLQELDELIGDPDSVKGRIAERKALMAELEQLEPPFVIHSSAVPLPSTWSRRSTPAASHANAGDVLVGLGACAGVATGTARIIEDPSDAADLNPGEILVAPVTDPGWTPLFTSAEAVVVNVGSPLSHAAILSRELGIPAVLAVEQATKRIKDGSLITVDGATGTVTLH